jgi:hypothetical protein
VYLWASITGIAQVMRGKYICLLVSVYRLQTLCNIVVNPAILNAWFSCSMFTCFVWPMDHGQFCNVT